MDQDSSDNDSDGLKNSYTRLKGIDTLTADESSSPSSSKPRTFQKEDISSPIKSVYLTTRYSLPTAAPSSSVFHLETRCIFSKGPWVQSSIIQTSSPSTSHGHHPSAAAAAGLSHIIHKDDEEKLEFDTTRNRSMNHNHSSSSSTYRHLVFSQGGSIHGIRKVRRVHTSQQQQPELWIVYGARQFSLITGGLTGPFHSILFDDPTPRNPRNTSTTGDGQANKTRQRMNHTRYSITVSDWIWDIQPIFLWDHDYHDLESCLNTTTTTTTTAADNNNKIYPLDKEDIPSHEFNISSSPPSSSSTKYKQSYMGLILLAIGLAHNAVDLWLLCPSTCPTSLVDNDMNTVTSHSLQKVPSVWIAMRLRKVVCDVRCITLCMHFYGWDWEECNKNFNHDTMNSPTCTIVDISSSNPMNNHESTTVFSTCHTIDYSLHIMVGTVSNQILLWNVLDKEEGRDLIEHALQQYHTISCSDHYYTELGIIDEIDCRLKSTQHILLGHDGVIFSCTSIRSGHYRYIASVSDDRTIRLWKCFVIDGQEESRPYELVWTAYGHTARIWHCAFLSWIYHETPLDCVITCGEDNTIRIWNMDDGQVLSIMQGHKCQNIWKIAINEWFVHPPSNNLGIILRPLISSGANDGTVKCWDLLHHIYQYALDEKSMTMTDYLTLNENVKSTLLKKVVYKRTREIYKIESEHTLSWTTNPHTNMDISVSGMKFYPMTFGKLLIASRDGRLRTLNVHSGHWMNHHPWAYPINNTYKENDKLLIEGVGNGNDTFSSQKFVDPNYGSCISIHPLENIAVIGTTKGDIIISSMISSGEDPIYVYSAKRYLAIHGLEWVDQNTLISFHVRGVAVLWSFEPILHSEVGFCDNLPQIVRVFVICMKGVTVGIPMCFAYDCQNAIIFLGDSRGNIAAFDLATGKDSSCCPNHEYYPAALAPFAHAKEHVRDMTLSYPDTLFSVGNDGLIHVITYYKDGTNIILYKAYSVPVSNLTALCNIWVESGKDGHRQVVVAGFFGNEFSIWDASSSYRLLNIPIGSRQRSYDLHVDIAHSFSCARYQLTIFVTRTDASDELQVYYRDYCSEENMQPLYHPFIHSLGTLSHGETVLDAAVLSVDNDQQIIFTGGHDGSLKISFYTGGAIVEVIDIAKFETCVRSLCCSKHSDSDSALLVVCGGKNVTAFYSWNKRCPFFLCQSRRHLKSQDHRINAVEAIPLICPPGDDFFHLVVTGDSDGLLTSFVLSETIGQPRRIGGNSLRRSTMGYGSADEYTINQHGDYPILDLDIARVSESAIIVGVGDSKGSVQLWLFPGIICNKTKSILGDLPNCSFMEYSAHQMGTNAIKMIMAGCEKIGNHSYSVALITISGGDDQALCVSYISIMIDESQSSGPSIRFAHLEKKQIVNGASSSAIKGIYISELSPNCNRWNIYTVGYEETLSLWEVDALERRITHCSSIKVDVSDVECLNGFVRNDRDEIVVCGQGIEIVSNLAIETLDIRQPHDLDE